LARQPVKELSLGVCLASIQWLVLLMGYTNIHIHTHMIALYLAGFAVWRSALNDSSASQNYIRALFFVVTIPLILQSLSGVSGGFYGLMLIGEHGRFYDSWRQLRPALLAPLRPLERRWRPFSSSSEDWVGPS